MRIVDEIVVSTKMDGVIHEPEGIYISITPEEGMDDVFMIPWSVADKLAEDIIQSASIERSE